MKRQLTLMMVAALAASAWAEDFVHPNKDGLSATKVVDTEGLTYYDYGGATGDAKSGCTGYVLFKSEDGESPLTITFEELDLDTESGNLYIYDGDCGYSGWKKPVTEGYVKQLSGTEAGYTYTTTSPSLSVLYYCPVFSSPGAGWKATVKAGIPSDMVFESATLTGSELPLWRGATDGILATLNIRTTGSLNPLTLDNLTFDVSGAVGSGIVENLRVYNGSVSEENLLATLPDGATSVSVGGRQLKGNNNLLVVADVKPDLSGSIPAVGVSALTIGGATWEVATAGADEVTVENAILMPVNERHTTYTITGSSEFYDAGGKDGSVPIESKGTITFVPATEGHIIRLNPVEWDLFKTSSIGKNDVFKLYAGREVKEENLIAQLLETPRVINSPAADGSLTLYFESPNGNTSGARSGWEIEVTEIVPTNMTCTGVGHINLTAPVPAAGASGVRAMLFDIRTENTLNPLSVSELRFALNQGIKPGTVGNVSVSYLGDAATNSPVAVYGSGSFGTDGKLKLNGSQTLAEGSNIFAVAIDIAADVLDGTPVEFTLESATVGGATVEADEVDCMTTVKNICLSAEGQHTHTLYDAWQFTHTPSEFSDSKYAAGTIDQVVTFTPANASAKAQMDFADFDVTYSSSSYYGTRATFEIYDGATTEGEPVWKLSSADASTTGPGKRIRSTAADGSLTVKFNPNSDISSYCGKGWHATVTPFIDHAAEVTAVNVSQSSTAIAGPGAVDADLIAFDVVTEGTLSPLTLHDVVLELRGASQMERVKIYRSTDGTIANSTLWGSAAVESSSDEPLKLTVSAASADQPVLAEESNRFIVAVDLHQTIASDVELDAALQSLGFGTGKSYEVADGDPEGSRLTKNVYVMTTEPSQTLSVGCPMLIYDAGGPDGKLIAGEYTLVLEPADPADLLVLDSNSFSIGGGKVHVFSGREATEENRLGKTTGYFTTGGPQNLTSKADDGSLTLQMKLIGTTLDGFELSVTPMKAVRHNVSAITMSDYSEFAATRGGSDLAIGRAILTVDGNKGVLEISRVKADVSGSTNVSDISKLGLYFAPAAEGFSPIRLVGEKVSPAADGTVEFVLAEPVTIDLAGEYSLWFGADIAASAAPGNTVKVALTGITADGSEVTIPADSNVSRGIKAGLSGHLRVGASGSADYPTIADAVDALKGGMEGTVMFLLEDGSYNEDITIADIQGTSADNLLIFTSASGDRSKVTITGGKSYAGDNDAVVTVSNTPYVVFRSLSFRPTSSGYGKIINYRNSSRHGTVDDCYIEAPVVADGSYSGTVPVKVEPASSSEVADNADTECDYFTIKNSHLLNGYIGLSLNSRGNVGDNLATGFKVQGNTIEGYASKGIYAATLRDFELSGNTITKDGINKSSIYAMDIYNAQGEFVIDSNRMSHTMVNGVGASISTTALYMRSAWDNCGGPSADRYARVTNNVITVNNSHNYTSYGMSLQKKYKNVLIAHNTIAVITEGSDRGGYPLGLLSPALTENTGLQVRNNLLQALSGSEEANASPLNVWDDADYTHIAFSGNGYYSRSGYVDNQSTKHDMEAYRELTGDATSVWKQAEFFSNIDLHLLDAEGLTAARLEAVTTDAEGTERPDPATIGAYEYKAVSTETPEIMEGYPRVERVTDTSATVVSNWSVGGTLYAMIQSADAAAPDAATLRQQRPVAVEADTEVSSTFNYLEQLTSYRVWMMVETPLGNASEIAVSESFTTQETIGELTVEIDWDEEPLHPEDMVLLQAITAGGKAPYTYRWTNRAGEEVGTEEILSEEATEAGSYRVTVSSADGQTATSKVHVDVYTRGEEVAVATFDDLGLAADSNWKYDPFNSTDTYSDSFYSGSFRFPNYPWMEYESWSGYGYASETSTEFDTWADQFRNPEGCGAKETAGYGVAYMMGADMTVKLMADPDGDGLQIPGMYAVNSSWALSSMRNGDGWCRKFDAEHGDYFTVTVEGLDRNGTTTGKVDINLADFRQEALDANGGEGTMMDKWTWIDLSPLGNVFAMRLSYTSSQQAQVPAYICLDEIGAKSGNVGTGVTVAGSTARLTYERGSLRVSEAGGESMVIVYSPDGLERLRTRQTGDSLVSLEQLPTGTYIARLTGEGFAPVSVRFVKR